MSVSYTHLDVYKRQLFKISPDETLNIIQELYEKKLVTYPRTDARVLSTAVSKEIHKNIGGLRNFPPVKEIAEHILQNNMQKGIEKTRSVSYTHLDVYKRQHISSLIQL